MFSDQVTASWNAINARNYSSLAALIFTLAEYALTIHSEYKYIWKWRASLLSPKGLYLVARYFGILTQIVNYSLVQIYLNRGPVPPDLCKIWFIFLAFSICLLFIVLDAVLLLRVYALYRKNAKIYYIVVPLVLQYFMPAFMVGKNAFREDSFNSHCDIKDTPMEVGITGAFAVLAHLPLWLATLWKRRETDGVEVARIVVHEGGWSFGLLTIYIGGILSYCVVSPGGNPFAVFVLPSVAFSMASCRMIIRMRALSPASPRQGRTFNSGSSIAFTTFINSHFTIEEGQVDQPKDKPKDDEQKEENEQKKDEPKEDKPTEEDEPKEDEKREGDERNEEEQNEEEQNEHEQNEDEQHQDEQNQEQNQDEQNEEDAQNEDEVKEDEPKEDEPKEDEPQEDESKHKLKDDEPKDEPQEDEPKHKPKDDEPYDETQILPAGDGSP